MVQQATAQRAHRREQTTDGSNAVGSGASKLQAHSRGARQWRAGPRSRPRQGERGQPGRRVQGARRPRAGEQLLHQEPEGFPASPVASMDRATLVSAIIEDGFGKFIHHDLYSLTSGTNEDNVGARIYPCSKKTNDQGPPPCFSTHALGAPDFWRLQHRFSPFLSRAVFAITVYFRNTGLLKHQPVREFLLELECIRAILRVVSDGSEISVPRASRTRLLRYNWKTISYPLRRAGHRRGAH